jgi:hypothetical protein
VHFVSIDSCLNVKPNDVVGNMCTRHVRFQTLGIFYQMSPTGLQGDYAMLLSPYTSIISSHYTHLGQTGKCINLGTTGWDFWATYF